MKNFRNGSDDNNFIAKNAPIFEWRCLPQFIDEYSFQRQDIVTSRWPAKIDEIIVIVRRCLDMADEFLRRQRAHMDEIVGINGTREFFELRRFTLNRSAIS